MLLLGAAIEFAASRLYGKYKIKNLFDKEEAVLKAKLDALLKIKGE